MSLLADKILTCRDCGRTFPFTVREQEFYAEKGFNNQPSRCPECRAANKARLNGGSTPGASVAFSRPERQMYPAVCATCGKATQVPFEPRLDRPVYCRDCFVPRPHAPSSSFERPSGLVPSALPERDSGSRAFGSRERGSGRTRERGSSFGSAAPERRSGANRIHERRTDWAASYDLDDGTDDDDEFSSGRRSGRNRRD